MVGEAWGGFSSKRLRTSALSKTSWPVAKEEDKAGSEEAACRSLPDCVVFTFTFMHLADAFIQSDLQLHSGCKFLSSICVPWELNPQPFALLTQCSTTEPHSEHSVWPRDCGNCSFIEHFGTSKNKINSKKDSLPGPPGKGAVPSPPPGKEQFLPSPGRPCQGRFSVCLEGLAAA